MKLALDLSKIERFDRTNFKRWSEDMLFYLETMNLEYVLYMDVLVTPVNDVSDKTTAVEKSDVDKSAKGDYVKDNRTCRRYMLHYLSNSLFDIYYLYESARKIWDALKFKYVVENFGLKKYVAVKFLDFKMQNGKSVIKEVHKYQTIVGEVIGEGMKMCDTFQAAALIKKLPPSWKDYKMNLKNETKDFTMQELVAHIHLNKNRTKERGDIISNHTIKANLVKQSPQ